MKEARVPPAHAANLVANSGRALYGVQVITYLCIASTAVKVNHLLSCAFMGCNTQHDTVNLIMYPRSKLRQYVLLNERDPYRIHYRWKSLMEYLTDEHRASLC